jgi:regulator of protease activity HflC (stomatin/prohibitin superfamily)
LVFADDDEGGVAADRSRTGLRHWLRGRLPFLAIAVQLLLLVVILFWDRIFIVIHSGEAGVLWNRFAGTQIGQVYTEGLHIISPLDKMAIYEVRKQVARQQLAVLSTEGLRLDLHLAIRYRPEYALLGVLHERIGPDYLTRVVVPQVESVLRKQLGVATAEQIYTNEDGLLTRAMLTAMEEAGRNFVDVEDIIIRRIELPDKVRDAIEQKLVQKQLLASYVFRRATATKEADRRRIEAAGIRDYQALVDETLSDNLLKHQGIMATDAVAASANPKTVVIGAGDDGVPIILNGVAPALSTPTLPTAPAAGGATAGGEPGAGAAASGEARGDRP